MSSQIHIRYGDYIPLMVWIITHNIKCQDGGMQYDMLRQALGNHAQKGGGSTYFLRERAGIDSKTIRRLRVNDNTETKTLSKLCEVLDCSLEDIAEYIPDEKG